MPVPTVEVMVVGQIARAAGREGSQPGGGAGAARRPGGLLGLVGADRVADDLLAQAASDRVDVRHVVRRAGARTALIVDVLEGHGRWRYLEDIPAPVLLTEDDVEGVAPALRLPAS